MSEKEKERERRERERERERDGGVKAADRTQMSSHTQTREPGIYRTAHCATYADAC